MAPGMAMAKQYVTNQGTPKVLRLLEGRSCKSQSPTTSASIPCHPLSSIIRCRPSASIHEHQFIRHPSPTVTQGLPSSIIRVGTSHGGLGSCKSQSPTTSASIPCHPLSSIIRCRPLSVHP
jgi:hypothetical protein